MNNVLGMLIGAEMDRGEGGSGVGGAFEGYVLEGVAKVVAPLAVTFAVGWVVQFAARRAFKALGAGEEGA